MDFNFISPSYKRADNCLTHKAYPSIKYAVCETEAGAYKKNGIKNLIVLPKGIQGNNARVRNYILDNYNDNPLVMMDDDTMSIGIYDEGKRIKLNEQDLFDKITNHIQLMKDLGAYLGGVNLILEPRAYRINCPYSFFTPILGPFNIHIKSAVRYSEELNLKADYDYFLEQIKTNKLTLRDNRMNYDHKKLTYKGGCAMLRNEAEERKQFDLFQKKWGVIVQVDKQSKEKFDINPKIRI